MKNIRTLSQYLAQYFGIFLLLSYLVVTPMSVFAQGRTLLDRFALFPSTDRVEGGSTERKLLSNGIEIWVHRRAAAVGVNSPRHFSIIHFIGNSSRAEVEVPGLNLLSFFPEDIELEVWSVNYPGFGGSSGQATLASFPEMALSVYDALQKEVDPSTIILSGTSIGSLPALYLATQRVAKTLILRNPVPLRELILEMYGCLGKLVLSSIPGELDSIRNASQLKIPVLFLTSEKDSIISPSLQENVIEKVKAPTFHIILNGIDHNDLIPSSSYSEIRESLQIILK